MQPAVLRSLEFDRIRDVLARLTLTALGRTRALDLTPSSDPGEIGERLARATEAAAFVASGGSLAIRAPEDLFVLLAALEVEDQPLDPIGLLGISGFLTSAGVVADAIARTEGPHLHAIARDVATFAEETAAVARAIEPSGEVSDRASPALREIRQTLRRQRTRLRTSLEELTHRRETAKYLQDQIITDRNGRYVVVVRAEHREAIAGIVHGSSASGASLYVEPLATVALNNEIVTLVDREQAEIRRILRSLTDAFRRRPDELEATIAAAAELDLLHAVVDLARRTDGTAPALVPGGGIEFRGARHPLLIPAVRELADGPPQAHGVVVPSDLCLAPPAHVLVISGPNTGGKTVALKAFGLLVVMAQAGLLIPVDPGSRFAPFRSVFADIGDEQSIAASLSTFSARVANIVATDRALEAPALVLLDEVGSGTDPLEGGALGAAVIHRFFQKGATVVATTHDETVKTYAATTEGVVTAGFGFDPDTFAPSYRLRYGTPGRSLALEIADRLGMPAPVIADARARLSGHESQLAAHLARLDREVAALERDRGTLAAERERLAGDERRLLEREARLAEREAVARRRGADRLQETVREARTEVDRIIATLKEQVAALQRETAAGRGPVLATGEVGRVRAQARAALAALADRASDTPASGEPLDGAPTPGQPVFVATLGASGVVRAVGTRHVEVEVGGKRLKVPPSALRRPAPDRGAPTGPRPPASGTAFQAAGTSRATTELVLIGATVDEALDRAAKFLDDALLADERRLRVVHGHGTGRLRNALTEFFRQHPLVAAAGPAPGEEGGAGATIVELKD